MAAVWNLPVLFICENNLYATEMPFQKATKNTSIAGRGAIYNIPGVEVNGNDVLAVTKKRGKRLNAHAEAKGRR